MQPYTIYFHSLQLPSTAIETKLIQSPMQGQQNNELISKNK